MLAKEGLRVTGFTNVDLVCVDTNSKWMVSSVGGDKSLTSISSLASINNYIFPARYEINPKSYTPSPNWCCANFSGSFYCWGHNGHRQLGDGTSTTRYKPTLASGITGPVSDVVYGHDATCLIDNGAAKCAGYNLLGQLGRGTVNTYHNTFQEVTGLGSNVTKIAMGNHSACAIQNGAVVCWGYNNYGQLGRGTSTAYEISPAGALNLTSGVTDIFTIGGKESYCAIKNGGLYCWGRNNVSSNLILGLGSSSTYVSTPAAAISEGSNVVELYQAGYARTYARTSSGQLYGWGYGNSYALGGSNRNSPYLVASNVSDKVDLYNDRNICYISTTGSAHCMGINNYGQVGDGSTSNRSSFVNVSTLSSNVEDITVGDDTTCALMNTGAVKCWGRNNYGQLGDGSGSGFSNVPVQVRNLHNGVTKILSDNHTVFAIQAGKTYAWGANTSGQLGIGTTADQTIPAQVVGIDGGADSIDRHTIDNSYCSRVNFKYKCWGNNSSYGTIGVDDSGNSYYQYATEVLNQ